MIRLLLLMLIVLFFGGPLAFFFVFIYPIILMYNSGYLTYLFWSFVAVVVGVAIVAFIQVMRGTKPAKIPKELKALRGNDRFIVDKECPACGKRNFRVAPICSHCKAVMHPELNTPEIKTNPSTG